MTPTPALLFALTSSVALASTGCREPAEPNVQQGWVLQADASLGTPGQGRAEVCKLRSSDFRDTEGTLLFFWSGLPATSFSRVISVNAVVQHQVQVSLAVAFVSIEAGAGDSVRIIYSGELVDTLEGRGITPTLASGSWTCAPTLPGAENGSPVATGQWTLEKR